MNLEGDALSSPFFWNFRSMYSNVRGTIFALACLSSFVFAQTLPSIPQRDRIRLAEAFRVMDRFGDRIWNEWNDAPFAVVLVTPKTEFLLRNPKPTPDFQSLGFDSLLGSVVYARPRTFPTDLLATFPAVNGVLTIVIGQAENTEAKESSRWVLTMLHEHFHQVQYSRPGYYSGLKDLNLDKGDQTGMWMLNFPFPYDSVDVYREFGLVAQKLQEAILSPRPEFRYRLNRYRSFRSELNGMLTPDQNRYLAFQLWQEGIARYTELEMAALIAREYIPTEAFQSLDDYVPFGVELDKVRFGTISEIGNLSLKELHRTAFYSFGASEGILLNRCNPRWREEYFSHPFSLEQLFPDK